MYVHTHARMQHVWKVIVKHMSLKQRRKEVNSNELGMFNMCKNRIITAFLTCHRPGWWHGEGDIFVSWLPHMSSTWLITWRGEIYGEPSPLSITWRGDLFVSHPPSHVINQVDNINRRPICDLSPWHLINPLTFVIKSYIYTHRKII